MENRNAQMIADLGTPTVRKFTSKQPQEIGFKEIQPNALDVTMTPALERSKTVGSPHVAHYWAERIYQACRSGIYQNPEAAYKGILVQAQKSGMNEDQEKALQRICAAAGLDIGEKAELNSPYAFGSAGKKQASAKPVNDVTGDIVAAVRAQLGQRDAVSKLGRIVANAKREEAFSKRKASIQRGEQADANIRSFAKAACAGQHSQIEDVYRAAKAMLLGQNPIRTARVTSGDQRRQIEAQAKLVVVCMGEAGRKLIAQGFTHQEVVKHLARKQRAQSLTGTDPTTQKVVDSVKTDPNAKVTITKDDKGQQAAVVQKNTAPPIKTAASKVMFCTECGQDVQMDAAEIWRHVDEEGYTDFAAEKDHDAKGRTRPEGKFKTSPSSEKNIITASIDEQHLAKAALAVFAPKTAQADEPEADMSREALAATLNDLHESGQITWCVREAVGRKLQAGLLTSNDELRAECAREMAE